MPVKNAAPFLDECLISIVSQTEKNWELIAVDDASDDDSRAILERFSKTDHRMRVLANKGSGIIHSLRTALAASSGNLVTRMDADDIMAPKKLQVLKDNLITARPSSIAVGCVKYFSGSQLGEGYRKYEAWLNQLTEKGDNFSDIYRECVIPSPCWMVFRDDLMACGAFGPDVYPEDYDLCFRFYGHGLRPIPTNSVLHYWRDHSGRSSRTDPNYSDNRFLELKLNWFLQLDRKHHLPLVLWGAGTKGKELAKMLISKRVGFHWICNNPNKIGRDIYGVKLRSPVTLESVVNGQVIVAVANPDEKDKLRSELEDECFFFC